MTDLKVVPNIADARIELDHKLIEEKVETYYKYLINYGSETASMWAMGNVSDNERDEFMIKMRKSRSKHGFKGEHL